ncbi:MAG: CPXCG motif-containing cysteine-rich protein [bacterium]
MQDTFEILCPYCGEPNEIYVDYSGGPVQTYVEDCQVCCQPWQVRVEIFEDEPVVQVMRSDE